MDNIIKKLNRIDDICNLIGNKQINEPNALLEELDNYYDTLPEETWTERWKPRLLHDLISIAGAIIGVKTIEIDFMELRYLSRKGKEWELICKRYAESVYENLIYQPLLPNGKRPDIAINPVIRNCKSIDFADILIDCKLSLVGIVINPDGGISSKEQSFYSKYCNKLAYWSMSDFVWCSDLVKGNDIEFIIFNDIIKNIDPQTGLFYDAINLKSELDFPELSFLNSLFEEFIDNEKSVNLQVLIQKQKQLHSVLGITKKC